MAVNYTQEGDYENLLWKWRSHNRRKVKKAFKMLKKAKEGVTGWTNASRLGSSSNCAIIWEGMSATCENYVTACGNTKFMKKYWFKIKELNRIRATWDTQLFQEKT